MYLSSKCIYKPYSLILLLLLGWLSILLGWLLLSFCWRLSFSARWLWLSHLSWLGRLLLLPAFSNLLLLEVILLLIYITAVVVHILFDELLLLLVLLHHHLVILILGLRHHLHLLLLLDHAHRLVLAWSSCAETSLSTLRWDQDISSITSVVHFLNLSLVLQVIVPVVIEVLLL